jgi:3-deoxy-D-manno-octulosonate 8-phosphate phosphatase (KDO 8-P phosphatase)
MDSITRLAQDIKLVIFDIDGVLTDGTLFFDNAGEEYKAFNSRDGHGIRMLMECGLDAAVITGRKSTLVEHRMHDLGVTTLYQGYRDKRPAFADLLQKQGLEPTQIAYVGDDVIDLPVMKQVGMAIAVQDAHPFVIEHADYVTRTPGGRGAAREVIETILQAQGLLKDKLESYLT